MCIGKNIYWAMKPLNPRYSKVQNKNWQCVVNVAVGEHYVRHQQRLHQSIRLYSQIPVVFWTDAWPPESPSHQEVHYAFKYYAMKAAVAKGYTTLLYLDASMYCVDSIHPIFERIQQNGFYFVGGAHNGSFGWADLREHISDAALEFVGLRREQLVDAGVVGGGVVGLDLTHPIGKELWEYWPQMIDRGLTMVHYRKDRPEGKIRSIDSEDDCSPISKDPNVKCHLGDEAVWSAILYRKGLQADAWKDFYLGENGPDTLPTGILRSDYALS